MYVNDAHREAINYWITLMTNGAPAHEVAAAHEAAQRQRFEPRAHVATRRHTEWWERTSDDGTGASPSGVRKRQKRSALDVPWMHDSDVGMHSDSTASGECNSDPHRPPVGRTPPLRAAAADGDGTVVAAAAAAHDARTVAPPPPEGMLSSWKAFRRVNVDVSNVQGAYAEEGAWAALDAAASAHAEPLAERGSVSFAAFAHAWLTQPRFCFNLHVERVRHGAADGAPYPPYREWHVVGVAVCWQPCMPCVPGTELDHGPIVYYLPLIDGTAAVDGACSKVAAAGAEGAPTAAGTNADGSAEGLAGAAGAAGLAGAARRQTGRGAPMHVDAWALFQEALQSEHSLKVTD
jgi:hypothetical protein